MNHFTGLKLIFSTILYSVFLQVSTAQKILISFDAPSNGITVTKAPLKYNKDFAYSLTLDDCFAGHYSVAYQMFKGGKLDDGQTYPGMFQTDGCGNNLPFKGGVAWNTVNPTYIDVHTGNVFFYMTWPQLDEMYVAGWDVFNHSYSHRALATSPNMSAGDYPDEIKNNADAVRSRTAQHIEMTHFVVPSGDNLDYKSC